MSGMMPPTPVGLDELTAIPRFRPEVARALQCFAERYVAYARLRAAQVNRVDGPSPFISIRARQQAKADVKLALEIFGQMYGDQLIDEDTARMIAETVEHSS
jgi:hypothetical protein